MHIRLARPKDIPAIQDITFQTALLGSSARIFWDDATFYFDLSFLAYLIPPTKYAFVAEDQGVVRAYVLCTPSKTRYILDLCFRVLPFRLLPRLLQGKYRISSKTICFILKCALDQLADFFIKPIPNKQYPAVLHINVNPSYQGKGLGSTLLRQALQTLKNKGIPGVHLHTTSYNEKACALYIKFGFREYSKKRTYLWQAWIKEKVYKIAYVKRLQET